MARGLQHYPNVDFAHGENSDFPAGRSRDNNGSNNGTPLNEFTLGDYQQFFAKLLRVAGISANGLPEDEYVGHQYFQALRIACMPYKYYCCAIFQSSTSAPAPTVRSGNTLTGIVWTRTTTGVYVGTKVAAFASGEVDCFISGTTLGFVKCIVNDADTVVITTKNTAGSAADGILDNISLEIRVY